MNSADLHAVRGEILHFLADPASHGEAAIEHFADGLLLIRDGHVAEVGPAAELLTRLPADLPVTASSMRMVSPTTMPSAPR